jgi:hypothetical protein
LLSESETMLLNLWQIRVKQLISGASEAHLFGG